MFSVSFTLVSPHTLLSTCRLVVGRFFYLQLPYTLGEWYLPENSNPVREILVEKMCEKNVTLEYLSLLFNLFIPCLMPEIKDHSQK